jgi:hypothetical protein
VREAQGAVAGAGQLGVAEALGLERVAAVMVAPPSVSMTSR